mgnify:CR=1 FL=1
MTREIYDAAVVLAEKSWTMTAPVRLLSVTGMCLIDRCAEQMALIDDTTNEKVRNTKLDQAMDEIRARYGDNSISYARLMEKSKDR